MNGDFKFMDDYDPLMHLFVVLDEFGSMSKDKVESASVALVTKITGEAPFVAPVADLNKIGEQYVTQLCTVLTTNAPDMGFNGVVVNPGALARRFVRVELEVNPEFTVPDTCRIVPRNLSDLDLDAPLWKGTVQVDAVRDAATQRWRIVSTFSTARELIKILVPMMSEKFKTSMDMADNYERNAQLISMAVEEAVGA